MFCIQPAKDPAGALHRKSLPRIELWGMTLFPIFDGSVAESGLKWSCVGTAKPSWGTELVNPALSVALGRHTAMLGRQIEFTPEQWREFKFAPNRTLRMDHFVKGQGRAGKGSKQEAGGLYLEVRDKAAKGGAREPPLGFAYVDLSSLLKSGRDYDDDLALMDGTSGRPFGRLALFVGAVDAMNADFTKLSGAHWREPKNAERLAGALIL